MGIGDDFQMETRHNRSKMGRSWADTWARPPAYKEYPDSPVVELTADVLPDSPPLSLIFRSRRSIRMYKEAPITAEELSYLLWAQGGVRKVDRGIAFRTAPSAGALYPIETYLLVNQVQGLEMGLYHYNVKGHTLELLRPGDFRIQLTHAALGQEMCLECSVIFIWSAIFNRSKWKYGQRAYRYIYLDAGHMAENLHLAAVSRGFGACEIGAFFDDESNELLGLDGLEESVILMMTVGYSDE